MTKEEIHNICLKYDIENYTINDDLSIDVDDNVDLHHQELDKLPLKFRNVTGYFNCSYNNLKTLEGSPSYVGSGFYCFSNPLETLKGIPLKLSFEQFYVLYKYTYSNYLEYCKVVERDLKFKKLLKCL